MTEQIHNICGEPGNQWQIAMFNKNVLLSLKLWPIMQTDLLFTGL